MQQAQQRVVVDQLQVAFVRCGCQSSQVRRMWVGPLEQRHSATRVAVSPAASDPFLGAQLRPLLDPRTVLKRPVLAVASQAASGHFRLRSRLIPRGPLIPRSRLIQLVKAQNSALPPLPSHEHLQDQILQFRADVRCQVAKRARKSRDWSGQARAWATPRLKKTRAREPAPRRVPPDLEFEPRQSRLRSRLSRFVSVHQRARHLLRPMHLPRQIVAEASQVAFDHCEAWLRPQLRRMRWARRPPAELVAASPRESGRCAASRNCQSVVQLPAARAAKQIVVLAAALPRAFGRSRRRSLRPQFHSTPLPHQSQRRPTSRLKIACAVCCKCKKS